MTPERGDILHLQFDPSSGKEMQGDHFCLVVSPKSFNERFKLAMVCPISGGVSNTARNSGFLISLTGSGLKIDGNIHAHQLKTLDWNIRNAKKIEKAPSHIVGEVINCLMAVFEED
ncbi:MAG: type II toxin-antitoxin system PemK/MazF family toxin [Pseudomonadota bacterium]